MDRVSFVQQFVSFGLFAVELDILFSNGLVDEAFGRLIQILCEVFIQALPRLIRMDQ